MRLRNIPRAEGVLQAHPIVIKDEKNNKGKWSAVFGNDHPVHIEIGMGKGQFILNLAEKNPDINYIGVERYSSVLLRAVEKYNEMCGKNALIEDVSDKDQLQIWDDIPNVRFICMDAADLSDVFETNEIQKIYLNFSDPWPKKRHARRRLTSKEFFGRYEKVLAPEGVVEFKTDNTELFQFSLDEVKEAGWTLKAYTWDLHRDEVMNAGNVMTEYEEKFSSMGNPIHKLIATK